MVVNSVRNGKECPTGVQSSLGGCEAVESQSASDADITGWSLNARDGEITSIGYHVSIWVQPLYCQSRCWAETFISISSTDKSIASVSSSGDSVIIDTNKLGWKVCSRYIQKL